MNIYFNYLKIVFQVFRHHSDVKILIFLYKIAKDESNQ